MPITSPCSQELLDALLAVQSEGWQALAAAVLFAHLKRWHALRLAKKRQQLRSGVSRLRSFKWR
jgi:hypothetical protein